MQAKKWSLVFLDKKNNNYMENDDFKYIHIIQGHNDKVWKVIDLEDGRISS